VSAFEDTGLDSLDYFASGNHVGRRTADARNR